MRAQSSELRVWEIGLGSRLTYGGGVARERAEACVERAFAVGINFVDTANVYARGGAAEFLGEVLAGRERSSYVLAAKVHFPMSATDRGLSRGQLHKQIDASLRRLRTDYVAEVIPLCARNGIARVAGFAGVTTTQLALPGPERAERRLGDRRREPAEQGSERVRRGRAA